MRARARSNGADDCSLPPLLTSHLRFLLSRLHRILLLSLVSTCAQREQVFLRFARLSECERVRCLCCSLYCAIIRSLLVRVYLNTLALHKCEQSLAKATSCVCVNPRMSSWAHF
eukprot:6201256-Pleurochrysis_carterae.AAC.2